MFGEDTQMALYEMVRYITMSKAFIEPFNI